MAIKMWKWSTSAVANTYAYQQQIKNETGQRNRRRQVEIKWKVESRGNLQRLNWWGHKITCPRGQRYNRISWYNHREYYILSGITQVCVGIITQGAFNRSSDMNSTVIMAFINLFTYSISYDCFEGVRWPGYGQRGDTWLVDGLWEASSFRHM